MRDLHWIALGVAALALAGCGQKSETTTTTNIVTVENQARASDVAPTLSAGQSFANAAASSDALEIATSKLAVDHARAAGIKKFAEQMIKAHTASTAKLKAAAGSASPAITPDPTLTAEQRDSLNTLQGKTGSDFDKAYAAAQVDAHEKTLAALKLYSTAGDVSQLKDFAAKLSPTVAAHLNMAKSLKP
jgi:putative membrane protein